MTDLGKIGTRETVSVLGEESEVDTLCDGRSLEGSLENRDTRSFVGLYEWEASLALETGKERERKERTYERDVDELIETSRTEESRIDLIGPVGSTDNENVLLGVHTVHFG